MSGFRRVGIAAVPLLAALLAGCGPALEWTRPNTTALQAHQDSDDCAALARDQAFRESIFYGPGFGYAGRPWGYRSAFPFQDGFMWRAQRESDLQDFCLRARGYALTAVRP